MAISNRGFGSMDPDKQCEIASRGGKAAHEKGVAHRWNTEEGQAAGRKGGAVVSQDREHMREIGRKGGKARSRIAQAQRVNDELTKMGPAE